MTKLPPVTLYNVFRWAFEIEEDLSHCARWRGGKYKHGTFGPKWLVILQQDGEACAVSHEK